MSTPTTTTTAKIASRRRAKLSLPPKNQKPYSRRELAAEVERLTGEAHDPGYLADIAAGTRLIKRLKPTVLEAVANLEARAAKAESKS
jgi:hypothetical protein